MAEFGGRVPENEAWSMLQLKTFSWECVTYTAETILADGEKMQVKGIRKLESCWGKSAVFVQQEMYSTRSNVCSVLMYSAFKV